MRLLAVSTQPLRGRSPIQRCDLVSPISELRFSRPNDGRPRVFGFFEEINHLLPSDRAKALEMFVDGVTSFKVVEQGLHRDSGACENRVPPMTFGLRETTGCSITITYSGDPFSIKLARVCSDQLAACGSARDPLVIRGQPPH